MLDNIHLKLLLATFAGWVGRQQSDVITYLIEENRVDPDPDASYAVPTTKDALLNRMLLLHWIQENRRGC